MAPPKTMILRLLNATVVAVISFLLTLAIMFIVDIAGMPFSQSIGKLGEHARRAFKENQPLALARTWWTAVDHIQCPQDEAMRARAAASCRRLWVENLNLNADNPEDYLFFFDALRQCERLRPLHLRTGNDAATTDDYIKESVAQKSQCIARLRPGSDSPPKRRAAYAAAVRELRLELYLVPEMGGAVDREASDDAGASVVQPGQSADAMTWCTHELQQEEESRGEDRREDNEDSLSLFDKVAWNGIVSNVCPRGGPDLFWRMRMTVGYFAVVYHLEHSDSRLERWILLLHFVLSGIWTTLIIWIVGAAFSEKHQLSEEDRRGIAAAGVIIWPFLTPTVAIVGAYAILGALWVVSRTFGGLIEASHSEVATICSCWAAFFSALAHESYLTSLHNVTHSAVHRLIHRIF